MKAKYRIILSIILSVFVVSPVWGLNKDDIISLKQNGISDATIQLIIKEKTIETCSFTVGEIIDFSKAGLSDETIRMLIKEGSFMKNIEPIIYGKEIRPLKFTTAKDVIDLKRAGLSNEIIQAIINLGSKDVNEVEQEKAWEMLNNLGIIMDLRENGN